MSSVDEAVTALVSLFTATVPTAQVIDGPDEGASQFNQQVILVGDGDIEGTAEFDSLASVTTIEDYVVPVLASVGLPGNNMQTSRNAAILLYETLKAAILVDPSLGLGVGFRFWPTGAWSVQQRPTENGRNAAVRWGVQVIATNT